MFQRTLKCFGILFVCFLILGSIYFMASAIASYVVGFEYRIVEKGTIDINNLMYFDTNYQRSRVNFVAERADGSQCFEDIYLDQDVVVIQSAGVAHYEVAILMPKKSGMPRWLAPMCLTSGPTIFLYLPEREAEKVKEHLENV